MTAKQEWDQFVQEFIDSGHSEPSAIRQAAVIKPGLHARMLREANVSRPNASVHQSSSAVDPTAITRFDNLVAVKRAQGRDRPAAVREVVHENPQLHRDYLAAVNAR